MHEVAHVDIRIDRDPGTPAYRQIYRQIRHQRAAGSIPAGALIASIHEYPGDKVRIVGADAGLHILLGDGEKRDRSELINLARVHNVHVYGTNRYWVGNARPMRNFVLVGFSQIREENAPEGIRRLGGPGTVDVQRRRSRPRACARENERAPASGRGRDAGVKREEVSLH